MENVTVSTLEAISLTLDVHVSELFAVVDDKVASPKPLRAGRKPKAG